MKRLGIVSLVSALIASMAAAQSGTISIEAKAAPLAKVLAELSQKSGQRLTASGVLQNEPVILKVTDQPLDVVMKRLASLTAGKWVESDGGQMLQRDLDAEKADAALTYAERTRLIRAGMDDWLKQNPRVTWDMNKARQEVQADAAELKRILDQMKESNSNLGQNLNISIFNSNSVTPASSVLRSVLEKFPADMIANIAYGQRVVYSTNRTQRQVGMPGSINASAILRQFIADYNLLVEANKEAIGGDPNVKYSSELRKATTPLQWPISTYMSVYRSGEPGSEYAQVELRIADSKGEIVGRAQATFMMSLTPDESESNGQQGQVINLSPTSQELIKALTQYKVMEDSNRSFMLGSGGSIALRFGDDGAGEPPVLSDEMIKILTQPRSYEPLSYHVAECLLELAKSENAQLAAIPNDGTFLPLAKLLSSGTVSTERVKTELKRAGLIMVKEGGWLEIRSPDRALVRSQRVSRNALTDLLGTVLRTGYTTLRSIGKYALQSPVGSFDQAYISIIHRPASNLLFGSDRDRQFLQLLGTLQFSDPNGVSAMQISLDQLTPDQKKLVDQIVFGPFGGMVIGSGTMVSIGMSEGGEAHDEPKETIMQEPTYAYAQGLPRGATLEISLDRGEDVVLARSPIGHRSMFFSASTLGMAQGFKAQGQSFAFDMLNPDQTGTKFTQGRAHNVNMKLVLSKDGGPASTFPDAWVISGATPVALSQLPASFLEAAKRAKDQSANMRFGFGGGDDGNRKP